MSEVLVTLTILGILASIIVPNVVQQYQKRVTITKLQKAYAILESAATNIAATTGCVGRTVNCTGLYEMKDHGTLAEVKPFIEKINEFSGFQGEIKGLNNNSSFIPYLYCDRMECNEGSQADAIVGYYQIITKDKIGYLFRHNQFNKGAMINDPRALSVYVITDTSENARLILGKNVFAFMIYDNFIVEPAVICYKCGSTISPLSKPDSVAAIEDGCDVTKKQNYSGMSCLAKIVKDGWKINY